MTIASIGTRMQSLQGRLTDAYERISDRTDKLIARVDAADSKHANAVAAQNRALDQIEEGVKAVENLARQMSNDPFPAEQTTHLAPANEQGVSVNRG